MTAGKSGSDLGVRSAVGVVLIAVALLALWAGPVGLWLLIATAAMLMLAEWCDLAEADPRARRAALFAACVPLAILAPPPVAAGPGGLALGLGVAAALVTAGVTGRVRLGLGVLYVVLPAVALVFIRGEARGLLLCLWVLAGVWATDIGAYFAGRTIGGPKLAPAISPNKTWAGLGGGVIAALAFGLILWRFLELPLALALLSPVLAVVAQAGDLFESALKRRAGVKDSGRILPGHGGVMDRLDGLVTAAPVAAGLILVQRML
jgi:phosphatidate cytidylyltransferase